MKTYLCGGINSLSNRECVDWREQAKKLLRTETLDPMRRDYRGRESDNIGDIVEGDLRDIGDSDYILVNATRPSWGTAMEIVYARQFSKYIVAFTEGVVSPWLAYHCDAVCLTIDEAVGHINTAVASRN